MLMQMPYQTGMRQHSGESRLITNDLKAGVYSNAMQADR